LNHFHFLRFKVVFAAIWREAIFNLCAFGQALKAIVNDMAAMEEKPFAFGGVDEPEKLFEPINRSRSACLLDLLCLPFSGVPRIRADHAYDFRLRLELVKFSICDFSRMKENIISVNNNEAKAFFIYALDDASCGVGFGSAKLLRRGPVLLLVATIVRSCVGVISFSVSAVLLCAISHASPTRCHSSSSTHAASAASAASTSKSAAPAPTSKGLHAKRISVAYVFFDVDFLSFSFPRVSAGTDLVGNAITFLQLANIIAIAHLRSVHKDLLAIRAIDEAEALICPDLVDGAVFLRRARRGGRKSALLRRGWEPATLLLWRWKAIALMRGCWKASSALIVLVAHLVPC